MSIAIGLPQFACLLGTSAASVGFGVSLAYVFNGQIHNMLNYFAEKYEYAYVLTKITEPISDTSEEQGPKLFERFEKKYFCKFTKPQGVSDTNVVVSADVDAAAQLTFRDDKCEVYKVPKSVGDVHNVDVKKALSDFYQLTIKARLVADNYAILKIHKDFLHNFVEGANNVVDLLSTDEGNTKFAGLKYVYALEHKFETKRQDKLLTNKFLARVSVPATDVTTKTTALNSPFKCLLDLDEAFECRLYGFTTPLKENKVTKDTFNSLKAGVTPNTDLVKDSYVVVELIGLSKTFEQLRNSKVVLSQGDNALGTLEFGQVLYGDIKLEGNTIPASPAPTLLAGEEQRDIYIVTKDANSPTSSTESVEDYRCKFVMAPDATEETTSSAYVTNYDDECTLIKIDTSETNNKIVSTVEIRTSFDKVKDFLKTETSTPQVHYKLIVDGNKLHNLDFKPGAKVVIEPLPVATGQDVTNSSATFTLNQKWTNKGFAGHVNLFLTKVKTDPSVVSTTLTNAQCFVDPSKEDLLGCSLYSVTPATQAEEDKPPIKYEEFAIGAALTTGQANSFAKDNYYVVKLDKHLSTDSIDISNSIYYQVPVTATDGTSGNTKNVELEIVGLMSGEPASDKKAMFLKTLNGDGIELSF